MAFSKTELRHKYLDNKSFKKEFKRIFFNLETIREMLLLRMYLIICFNTREKLYW
ncbi:hypothetical protein OVS_02185 [Mycoplasma ovis str. Michigan]|uniref:Transposase n=1 Tax=Mycoplasma ovis str. Michigan TaxID=1415773 RepID=A0ABM5P1D6_9MOLU|nr:hypothetical protein OVS_02185 [Mycoplasma ovis str. Michigan]